MVKTPATSKARKETTKKRINATRLTLIVVGVLVLLALIWVFARNESLYSPNKATVRADLSSILDQVTAPGQNLYTDIVDYGCDSGNSVGLATYVHCEFGGYKYFASKGSLGENVKSLDALLSKSGWKRNPYIDVSDATKASDEQVISGNKGGSVPYVRGDGYSTASIEVAFSDDTLNSPIIESLVASKKLNLPSPTTPVFGVQITETYWSCRSSSIFKLPCPSPPSDPHS